MDARKATGLAMWIMEQPVAIGFFGLVVVVALIGGLLRTGRTPLLYGAILTSLFTVGLLVVERYVVTPREEVRATLYVIAGLIEENDVNAVLRYISAGRSKLRESVRRNMEQIEVLDVKIKRNLTIDVTTHRGTQVAAARFNVVARLRGRRGLLDERPYPRFVVVTFRKEDGQWRVRQYEASDPRRGI